MSATPLHEVYAVSPRFIRSMSLTRDFDRPNALDGYLLTSTGRDVLRRLGAALRKKSDARAWSLTGPYGSGKSSFALFAAQLLAGDSKNSRHARELLRTADPALGDLLFGSGAALARRPGRLVPILVSGTREPIEPALARQIARSLRRACQKGRPPALIERLERLAVGKGSTPVVTLLEEANEFLRRYEGEAAGILLVIDELGKFLEYSSGRPDHGDIFVLQELAELAARSERPFLLITILHQAIARYADQLSASRRTEWAKVQGRFEDIAFEERSDEILRLLARSLKVNASPSNFEVLRHSANNFARQALTLGIRVGSLPEGELRRSLVHAHPLHPLTTLVLGPLFRQLAQNERSLFAFLSSAEPFGFQEFLRATASKDAAAYRLDQLYDYIVAALGPSLIAQQRGRAWAEVQAALDRLGDASLLEIRVAKTVGLLQAVGATAPIGASLKVIQVALTDGQTTPSDVDKAIEGLLRRSCLLFRRHLGSYVLWEGSDIDIDARVVDGRRAVDRELALRDFLSAQVPPTPHVARRHYFRTGTLRFFEAHYADLTTLPSLLASEPAQSDGRVIFCLPSTHDERESIRELVMSTPSSHGKKPTLIALPTDVSHLREHCFELACLTWVLRNTPELEGDRIARKEIHARLSHADDSLRAHLAWLFTPALDGEDRCKWFAPRKEVEIGSPRELSDFVSELCDRVYHSTPRWRNELINRRVLSSAAAKARRNLVEAMIERGGVERLGIAGAPPELSMYEVLLRGSRIHRQHKGVWGFYPPDANAETPVRELWDRVEEVFAGTAKAPMRASECLAELQRPPFGLKDGLLPVIFAAALLRYASEVALYEEGTFIPGLTAAVFERLCRSPERFAFQRFRIAGPRADVFSRYAAMLAREAGDKKDVELLDIVKPLVRFVRELPEFVAKTTKTGPLAQKVLRALKDARQPDQLLFSELPAACGVDAFDEKTPVPEKVIDGYFRALRDALAELQRAYPALLAEIERLTLQALGRPQSLAEARRELAHEARLILNLALDARVKSFLLRLADDDTEATPWLEGLGTLLAGRPPASWDDTERARFEVQLAAAARSFRHYASLAFEMEKAGFALLDGDPRMLRISVTSLNAGEVERVVQVPNHLAGKAEDVVRELRAVLSQARFLENPDASAAVLARLAQDILASVGTRTDVVEVARPSPRSPAASLDGNGSPR